MTDITYIRTQEGFAYLAAAEQADHRYRAAGVAHGGVTSKDEEQGSVPFRSGSQFTSMDWAAVLKHHSLEHSPLGDTLFRLEGKG